MDNWAMVYGDVRAMEQTRLEDDLALDMYGKPFNELDDSEMEDVLYAVADEME